MSGIKFINVTQPFLPPLNEFIPYLEQIWDNKWLTNNGDMHNALEKQLQKYLKVQHLSLFTNGTLPIITALQALRLTGEVITTPYSFVATTHSLWWNGIKPVFVDVEPETFTIDPERIEQAITPRTTAILPVHVYGYPCKVDAIQAIADKYGLKVIYDAAHAFGVEINGKSILDAGDMSTLSFHATKTYNTAEGGALICHDEDSKKRIDFLKNFGFAGESPVINGDGSFSRDFTYIDNVIEANEKALFTPTATIRERATFYNLELSEQHAINLVFNVAYGGNTTLNQLFEILRENLAHYDKNIADIQPVYGPPRTGDIPHYIASILKAKRILDYNPRYDALQGFKAACEWYWNNLK